MTASDGHQDSKQANPEHVARLTAGVEAWNRWRTTVTGNTPIELAGAQLQNMDLRGADLHHAHLTYAHLAGSDLTLANLAGAKLDGANLDGVNLMEADLFEASAHKVHMRGTIFDRTNLMGANFSGARMHDVRVRQVVTNTDFRWQHSGHMTTETEEASFDARSAFTLIGEFIHISRLIRAYYAERRERFHQNHRVYTSLESEPTASWSALVSPCCRLTIRPDESAWYVAAEIPEPSFPMSFRGERTGTRLKKMIVGEDVLTGDAVFDDRVHLKGSAPDLIGRLDVESRKTIMALFDAGAQLENGRFVIQSIDPRGVASMSTLMGKINRLLASLIHLCQALGDPASTESILRKRARVDFVNDVRINAVHQWFLTQGVDRLPSGIEEQVMEAAFVRILPSVDTTARLTIMDHLAAIGSADSIGPLRAIADGLMVDRQSKDKAREALTTIASRTGLRRGGLSLSTALDQVGGLATPTNEQSD